MSRSLRYNSGVHGAHPSYSDPALHRAIGQIIRRCSENTSDIRKVASSLIGWPATGSVLDLGCGYGWFEEALSIHVNHIRGVDCLAENRNAFLDAAKRVASDVRFDQELLPRRLDATDESFDVVLSVYSLYFFPQMVEEAQRVLKKGGVFLVVTHSERMMTEGEHFFEFTNLKRVLRNFSAESGPAMLARWFGNVRAEDYDNAIVFHREDRDDLLKYIDFKREFIEKDFNTQSVKETMTRELDRTGTLRFNKNDRIFVAVK